MSIICQNVKKIANHLAKLARKGDLFCFNR